MGKSYRTIPPKPFKMGAKATIELDGVKMRVEVAPYTYGTFKRYATGPRGGTVLKECERALYVVDGKLYRHVNDVSKRDEDGNAIEWRRGYIPFTGVCRGRFMTKLPPLKYEDGVCVGTV